MTDHLLYKCIDKFDRMLISVEKLEDAPPLPDSLVVYHVKNAANCGISPVKKRISAWRYSSSGLMQIPVDAEPVLHAEESRLYRESAAEFSINRLTGKAYIGIYVGEGLKMGFEYDVSVSGTTFYIGNEKVIWK